ncbi:uncharacterized protein F4812DRAFT_94238 [Daldinia caldariorum]|uniref:uncharacterized protein n=1 Tax=Daldinia caldariorum TaxID=326644 RepID=UPI0020084369|nr:uncharacterized protein F4812DRAFT_94238 [Daldinia caldariorum]KAI1466032.1 hypothetical protein F4812DRAFT_94238 [Daldinia caldariorum]
MFKCHLVTQLMRVSTTSILLSKLLATIYALAIRFSLLKLRDYTLSNVAPPFNMHHDILLTGYQWGLCRPLLASTLAKTACWFALLMRTRLVILLYPSLFLLRPQI